MSACKVPAHPYHSPVNHLNIRWRRHPTWWENEWFWSASGSKQMKLYLNEWDDAESKAETKESAKRGEKLNRSHSNASLKLWTGSIFNILSVQDLFWNHHSRNKSLLLTYDSLLAKEYVEGGQIFFPGIVGDRFTRILKTNYHPIRDSDSELIWILMVYHWLEFNKGVIVLLSVGVGQPLDVIRQWGSVLSMINLFHLCKYTCWSNNN